ncbi:hypothetical protein FISHEDRAFT_47339 [Fistulina hepatica ATCC 64428]|uniref:Zn(2)-C6 fungal-type domain-containing protein n=1 Tax=Fistulina hepatica ATCC 64428 TaxID=1128425 RepID=A0A0D7A7Q8_9AGAR|nr:hypothetical protein FISHEDRAFT_47339 [Fistulina hepatica ATCC 64428]
MSTPGGAQRSAPSSSRSKPLKRGRACMNCRYAISRCDAVRPICGPCSQHPKEDPCEYDGAGRSRTRALEETVSRLEARIHELENPGLSTPSVTLYHPYSSPEQRKLRLSPLGTDSLILPTSWSPQSSPSVSPPSATFGLDTAMLPSPMKASTSSPGSLPTPLTPLHKTSDEPDPATVQALIGNFLSQASEFGFFLSPRRFQASALLSLPLSHHARPLPALMHTVYLLGARLSNDPAITPLHTVYLASAPKLLGGLAGTSHPRRVLHTMQAHVLLAYYFFHRGAYLEAKYHASAAATIAITAGLHKIRSPHPFTPTLSLTSIPLSSTPPEDAIDEGERISGMWSVFMLNRLIAVAMDPPSGVCGIFDAPGMQIDTPWPLDVEAYRNGGLHPEAVSTGTVRNFVNNVETFPASELSLFALCVRAAMLLHRATYLAGQYYPAMPQRDYQVFANAFQSTHALIVALIQTLPPLQAEHLTPPENFGSPPPWTALQRLRTLLLVHGLARTAMIKLHLPFVPSDATSRHHCVAAARAIFSVQDVDFERLGTLNPAMGTVWSSACIVLIDEIARVRTMRAVWAPEEAIAHEQDLFGVLSFGLAVMSVCSDDGPLMSKFPTLYLLILCNNMKLQRPT